ncbi:MAG: hypothetical protein KGL75_07105 [Acidobacteriota bacterium]|nr:hypothetical protein [Acidobacteriota bacterium]
MKSASASVPSASCGLGLEQEVLRALCVASLPHDERSNAVRALSSYAWRDHEHEVVFRAIELLRNAARPSWRDELPAQAARMGFPDVDWFRYFEAAPLDRAALIHLITRLLVSRPG